MDRWLIASFDIAKSEIAYFTVAVQAGSLIMFPIEKLGELTVPYISNLARIEDLSRDQAKKLLLLIFGSVLYIVSFGILLGSLFFRLYKQSYLEGGWHYFLIIIFGNALYPFFIFARGFLIRFFPIRILIVPFFMATGVQVAVSICLMYLGYQAVGAAIGKSVSLALLSLTYLFLCLLPLIKAALKV